MIFKRHGKGPLLSRRDIPPMPPEISDPSSVFNPGAVQMGDETFLLLRVQTRGRHTFIVPARGDGFKFTVATQPTEFFGLQELLDLTAGETPEVFHIYDPRISVVEGQLLVVTAVDTDQGCRLAIWRPRESADDGFAGLSHLELAGLTGGEDTRNGVIFPARIDGRYWMLERPNDRRLSGGPTTGRGIVLSASEDLLTWRKQGSVLSGRPHYWDEIIGSGPPPVRVKEGWLHIYHGVATHFQGANVYQAGAVLLNAEDPRIVEARTRDNILEPRETWEMTGQVPNVVFPSGMVVTPLSAGGLAGPRSKVRLYYGAADTCIGLAVTTIRKILDSLS